MSDTKEGTISLTGGGWLPVLGILFVGLKLTGFINWSWWWVLLPFYGGFAAAALILVVVVITGIIFRR